MARSSVLLPDPLGPSTHTISAVADVEVDVVERGERRRTARVRPLEHAASELADRPDAEALDRAAPTAP